LVVVSAMGKTTDDLIRLANEVSVTQPPREYDMLVSSGERISMALLCMAWPASVSRRCRSPAASRHHHRHDHTRAKILDVKGDRLRETLALARSRRGRIPRRVDGPDVTTLGRGGSDTTAWRWPRCSGRRL